MARLLSQRGTISEQASQSELDAFTGTANIATVGTVGTGTWEGTTVAVNQGGTGATSLTDGGVLLGSGTSAVTATAVLADGEILVGDGTTDPVALDVGSSSAITVLGTVATGTWEGTTVAVAQGGTGVTSKTGTGNVVLSSSPTLVTPALGTPASGVVTNLSGVLPVGVTGGSGLNLVPSSAANCPAFAASYSSSGGGGVIASADDTYVSFGNLILFELDANGDNVTGTYDDVTNRRWTPTTAGYYCFFVSCAVNDVADGGSISSSLWLDKTGSLVNTRDVEHRVGLSGGTKASTMITVEYMDGSDDFAEGRVKHADGSSRAIVGANYTIWGAFKIIT